MRDSNASKRNFQPELLAALNAVRDASYVPRITYFDTRGDGEVIRLILEYAKAPYNERRVEVQEWPDLKSSFAFANLPVFQEGDLTINDADAIYRHLARKHNLYGDGNLDAMRCDIVHENVKDALDELFGLYQDSAFDKVRVSFERNKLPDTLFRLESFFETNQSNSGYWVGKRLSYVDLLAFHYLDSLQPLAPEVVASFRQLHEFSKRIAAITQIRQYLDSERRPLTLCWPLSTFGGTAETSRS